MKININIVLLITAVVIAPLTLSNCIIAINNTDTSSQAIKLLKLEESRIKGTISDSQYKTQKNELMKPSNS
ncbi:MAG: hypothetical protein RIR27_661 [Pseudomonadota bacterium]